MAVVPKGPASSTTRSIRGDLKLDAGGQGGGRRLADGLGTGLEASLGEGPPIQAAQGPRTPAAAGQGLESGPGQAQDIRASVGFRHGPTVVESRPRINPGMWNIRASFAY